ARAARRPAGPAPPPSGCPSSVSSPAGPAGRRAARALHLHLGQVLLVELDLRPGAQPLDELLLGRLALLLEQLGADLPRHLLVGLAHRLAPAGLLDDVEAAAGG